MLAYSLLIYENFQALDKVCVLKDLIFKHRILSRDISYKPQCLFYHCLVTWAKYVWNNP